MMAFFCVLFRVALAGHSSSYRVLKQWMSCLWRVSLFPKGHVPSPTVDSCSLTYCRLLLHARGTHVRMYVDTSAGIFPRFFRQTIHREDVISKRVPLVSRQGPSPALAKRSGSERGEKSPVFPPQGILFSDTTRPPLPPEVLSALKQPLSTFCTSYTLSSLENSMIFSRAGVCGGGGILVSTPLDPWTASPSVRFLFCPESIVISIRTAVPFLGRTTHI